MVCQREGDGGLQLGVALVLGRGTFHPVCGREEGVGVR